MLTVEYLHRHGLYLVIPVNLSARREDDQEFLFSNYLDAKTFIDHYLHNPIAADFAYQLTERNRI